MGFSGADNAVSFMQLVLFWNSVVKPALLGHIHNATAPGAPTTNSTNMAALLAGDTTYLSAPGQLKLGHLKVDTGWI